MKQVFLSFHFGEDPRDASRLLANQVQDLLLSHELVTVTGEVLGGRSLTPEIMRRIERSDALIALMTRREPRGNGRKQTHPWVIDECNHARSKSMPAIALVETGVDLQGAYQEHERIPYRADNPMAALIRLSSTIGRWKREAGRIVKVQVLVPGDAAKELAAGNGLVECTYRFYREGRATTWQKAEPVPEEGGIFLYLPGAQDDYLIQVQVKTPHFSGTSAARSQWIPVEVS